MVPSEDKYINDEEIENKVKAFFSVYRQVELMVVKFRNQ